MKTQSAFVIVKFERMTNLIFLQGLEFLVGFKTTQFEHIVFKNTTLACVIIKQTVLSKGWGWTLYMYYWL